MYSDLKVRQQDIDDVLDLARELFDGDLHKATKWMRTSSKVFFGDSPLDSLKAGHFMSVLGYLKEGLAYRRIFNER